MPSIHNLTVAVVKRRQLGHFSERIGQAYFNVLHEMDPLTANLLRASTIDPYYQDDNLGLFFIYLSENGSS